MTPPPDHIRTSIAQRQRQRIRCAQTIETLATSPQLLELAGNFVTAALQLLHEDQCDLNGTPGVREAISVERNAWTTLQQIVQGDGRLTLEETRSITTRTDTIKRSIEAQGTLIELAIPKSDTNESLQKPRSDFQKSNN